MNEFILSYDTSIRKISSMIFVAIIFTCIGLAKKENLKYLMAIPITIIMQIMFALITYAHIAPESLKKEAISRINSAWIEKIKKDEIPNIPVRSITVDGNYLKIRLINNELCYVPFEKIDLYKRKVSVVFYKSAKVYEEQKSHHNTIIPIIDKESLKII